MGDTPMDAARFAEVEAVNWQALGAAPTDLQIELARIGTTIRVQEVGDGPPIVFVHGGAVSGSCWAPLAARLPQFRCLLVDRPGCGLSPPLPTGFADIAAFETFSDGFVADVLDGLGLDSAIVVGNSYGGFVTIRSAAAHPDRVERLIEFGSCLGAPIDHLPLVMRLGSIPAVGRLMAKMPPSKGAARSMLKQIGLKEALASGRVTDEMVEWFLSMLRDTDTLVNENNAGPRVATLRGLVDGIVLGPEVLERVTMPSLFVWGDGDPMGDVAVARTFTAGIPGAELDIWPGVGHAPWMDDPERAAASVVGFVTTTTP